MAEMDLLEKLVRIFLVGLLVYAFAIGIRAIYREIVKRWQRKT